MKAALAHLALVGAVAGIGFVQLGARPAARLCLWGAVILAGVLVLAELINRGGARE